MTAIFTVGFATFLCIQFVHCGHVMIFTSASVTCGELSPGGITVNPAPFERPEKLVLA